MMSDLWLTILFAAYVVLAIPTIFGAAVLAKRVATKATELWVIFGLGLPYYVSVIILGFGGPSWYLAREHLFNDNTSPRFVLPGDVVTIDIDSVVSVNGYWKCESHTVRQTNAHRVDGGIVPWEPEELRTEGDRAEGWGDTIAVWRRSNAKLEHVDRDIQLNFRVPDDPRLARSSLSLTTTMTITYPELTGGTVMDPDQPWARLSGFATKSRTLIKTTSFYVGSVDERTHIEATSWQLYIWYGFAGVYAALGAIMMLALAEE